MKNELVVKDNALINASYNLEVTEQRLILLAIINARETGQGITSDSKLEIHAHDYASRFDVSNSGAYKALKEAVNNLFDRQFSFKEPDKQGNLGVVRSRWVSRIKYIDATATLEVTFAPDVVPLITRLEQHFTSYQLKQVAQLTSKYAIRLYEMLIAWRATGKVPEIELSEFRNRLDGIITFNSLDETQIIKVAEKILNEVRDQLKVKGVQITVTKAAKEIMAKKGFDPAMGARPMKRVIQDLIKKPVAKEIVVGSLNHGGRVKVDATKDGEITLKYTTQEELEQVKNEMKTKKQKEIVE